MDNKPIRHLTPSQVKQYYAEYLEAKRRKVAGDILDLPAWKNEVEEYLDRHAKQGGPTYSKTAIKEASRRVLMADQFSEKQFSALEQSFKQNKNSDMWRDLKEKHPEISPYNLRANAAIVYQFLKNYSGEWNQYFNS